MISSTHVRSTIVACIHAMTGTSTEYAYCRLREAAADAQLPQPLHEESLDYSALHHRYDVENRFLHAIETGDVENVLIAKRDMTMGGMGQNRYVNAVYMDPITGLSMIRALVRKAAERGGASLVEIHEITQRALQLSLAEPDITKKVRIIRNMIMELTEAVDRARSRMGSFSPSVRKAVDILRHNYSQEFTLPFLAGQVGLSPSHLSRSFSKEVGMSVSHYIAALRCEEAAAMLKSSDAPVQEIAAFVGYPDNNYFVKVFKKQYGMTPSEYRMGKTDENK